MNSSPYSQLLDQFHARVAIYKRAMSIVRNKTSSLDRCIHGLRTFGVSYVQYQLSKRKLWLFSRSKEATLFFGRKVMLPGKDIGSHSLALYGLVPHRSERKLTEYLIKNLKPEDVFFDIGAHLGFYTALGEKLVNKGQVYAFEANPKLVSYLDLNFRQSRNVRVVPFAVSEKSGYTDFYDASKITDSSESSRFNIGRKEIDPILIPAISLDAYIKEGHASPTIMKIDIEGGEYAALDGARILIEKAKPQIILEVWGGDLGIQYSQRAVDILSELGYRAYPLERGGVLGRELAMSPVAWVTKNSLESRDNLVFLPQQHGE